MRAIRARYNPYLQTRHRVEQLASLGHSVDKVRFFFSFFLGSSFPPLPPITSTPYPRPAPSKVEFIVMGGTFMALDNDYRDYFIRNLHDALSGHTSNSVAEAVRYNHLNLSLRQLRHGGGDAQADARAGAQTDIPPPPPCFHQLLGAQSNKVHWHHDRDAPRLLSPPPPERHAGVRMHPSRDWRAECVRGRGP